MTRTNIPMMPGLRSSPADRSFECLGFAVVQRHPTYADGWHDIYKDGEWVEACKRRHVEHMCLMLLRSTQAS